MQANKPKFTESDIRNLANLLYGLNVKTIQELNAYDDQNFHIICDKSCNPDISKLLSQGYILKIINSDDSRNIQLADGQTEILLYLKENNYPAPVPIKNLKGEYYSIETCCDKAGIGREHIVKLLEFQNGSIFKSIPGELRLYRQFGEWLGRMDLVLKGFHHPVFESHSTMWHLKTVPNVKNYTKVVPDNDDRKLINLIIDKFIEIIVPKMGELKSGMIHGDFNEQNVLVDKSADNIWNISGVLDFGDANHSCYLFNLGTAMCYTMLEAARNNMDPMLCAKEALSGYFAYMTMERSEMSLLKLTICSRLCQSLVLGLYTSSLQPNNIYVSSTQATGWLVLKNLWNAADESISSAWDVPKQIT